MLQINLFNNGELVINKESSSLYCKNTKDFSTARLLLDTNALVLDENVEHEFIKICLRDINAFRSSINIITIVEQKNEAILNVAESIGDNNIVYAKYIEYKGKTKFKLISVDPQVIEQFISTDLKTELPENWSFNIDPSRLDIIQNRTGNIVNTQDDVSIYIYPEYCEETETTRVIVDLNARKSTYINSIALPIAEESNGELPEDTKEIAIHESSFRLMNILRTNKSEDLYCFYSCKYNIFFIRSMVQNEEGFWIKSRLMLGAIKGK